MAQVICKICFAQIDSPRYLNVKEMMFGSGENFKYFLCPECNCLQLEDPPENISLYYTDKYYTTAQKWDPNQKIAFKHKLRGRIARSKLFPLFFLHKPDLLWYIYYGNINVDSKILDVGCGRGDLLHDFSLYGFINLTGIDPYLEKESIGSNIKLLKTHLQTLSSRYDFIIFNHSFEHIPDQHKSIEKAKELLADSGTLLIRLPLLNYAFEKYKSNWVQLDAPRHFYLHSEKSFNFLCEKHGLEIKKVVYDSTEFQFMGSEQYEKNIPLVAPNSYLFDFDKSIFTKKDKARYIKHAKKLNGKNKGDQAAFFIKKK